MGMSNCPRPVRAIMILLLLSATVLVALAQQPTPCQTPPQWQGKFSRRDEKKNFTMFADIAYDETNRRVREVEYLEDGADRAFYDVLYLHNINKEYKIDLRHQLYSWHSDQTVHPLRHPSRCQVRRNSQHWPGQHSRRARNGHPVRGN